MPGVEEEIRDLVATIIEKPANEINPDANFFKDLGVDSMMALEILAAIEKKYKISIPEEKLAQLTTLNQTIAVAKEFIK
ncbi:MAG: acyl carrier protein [Candidatus Omnitrophica bacterium]|nr:acyl carrier protein [Candidatus Omnitrophota bacterium]